MEPKFNFYDFVGYVIPGGLFLLFIYWLLIAFVSISIPLKLDSIGDSLLILILSYTFGHLLQSLSNKIESNLVRKWGGWHSIQLLTADNEFYTDEFKTKIFEFAEEIFGVVPPNHDEEEQSKKRNEIFNLCYSLVVQEDIAQHTEIFNGLYSLYRGLIAVNMIGIFIMTIITLKHLLWLALFFLNTNLPSGNIWNFNELQLGLSITFLLLLVASKPWLESRLERFSQHFADSVYRNFYVWKILNDQEAQAKR